VATEIVGREGELASLRAWLDQTQHGPRALVLEGSAGIGKSTLWLATLELARARGFRVLSSRPAETERGYAFAGLGDVFEDVLDEVLPCLPPPRRRALEVALLVEEVSGPADPRTLGVAVRHGLDVLAADGPLVVAVDDVQWLDRSSARALAFALRRLHEPVVLLLSRRLGEGSEPSEIEDALGGDSIERLPVGPLSVGALQRLLRSRLDRVFARPTLLRIHESSGGNPLYALELARALGADVDPTRPLPVPESPEALVDARLEGLPEPTREALVLVSVLGTPSAELLEAAGRRRIRSSPHSPQVWSKPREASSASGTRSSRRCSTRACRPRSGGARTAGSPGSSRTRSSARATSLSRRIARTLKSPRR